MIPVFVREPQGNLRRFFGAYMPFVMLRKNWPGTFRRTINAKSGCKVQLIFEPGTPVDLTTHEIECLRSDIGVALMPVEFDEKARPRMITEDVVPEEPQKEQPQAKAATVRKPRKTEVPEPISEPQDAN